MIRKTIIFFTALLLFVTSYAQLSIGPRIGIQTAAAELGDAAIRQELDSLSLDGKLGFRLGMFVRLGLDALYIQPELLLTSTKSTYSFHTLASPGEVQFRDEDFLNIDIPVVVGLKFAAFRVQAGPVASIRIQGKSDFENLDALSRTYNQASWGAQLGIGLDLWKLLVDLNYQLPLNKGEEGITINGQSYGLSTRKGIAVLSVGLKL